MATAILLYNGLHFPVAMIDKGIAWAANTGGDIIALFVISDRDQEEGYPFPNDLDEAEEARDDSDAMGKDMAIIADNIRLMRHQSTYAGVSLKTQILPAPKQELHSWLEKAELIFVSEDPLDPPLLSIDSSRIKTALATITTNIEWIQ